MRASLVPDRHLDANMTPLRHGDRGSGVAPDVRRQDTQAHREYGFSPLETTRGHQGGTLPLAHRRASASDGRQGYRGGGYLRTLAARAGNMAMPPEASWPRCSVHFPRDAPDCLPRKADDGPGAMEAAQSPPTTLPRCAPHCSVCRPVPSVEPRNRAFPVPYRRRRALHAATRRSNRNCRSSS